MLYNKVKKKAIGYDSFIVSKNRDYLFNYYYTWRGLWNFTKKH